jgi:thiol-disulfide isomerase/thioredoxin
LKLKAFELHNCLKSVFVFGLFITLTSESFCQRAPVVKFEKIEGLLSTKNSKVQVVNFWATWCAPCVKELPYFEKINSEADSQVTLISLDLTIDESPEKVYKFIERKKIMSKVLILDEADANYWIEKIDKGWSGSLPATLVVNTITGKRKFIDHELRDGELEDMIKSVK